MKKLYLLTILTTICVGCSNGQGVLLNYASNSVLNNSVVYYSTNYTNHNNYIIVKK